MSRSRLWKGLAPVPLWVAEQLYHELYHPVDESLVPIFLVSHLITIEKNLPHKCNRLFVAGPKEKRLYKDTKCVQSL